MDKNADLYANIFTPVIFDMALPMQTAVPMESVFITAGHFRGVNTLVNTVVIENDGIVSISVQFNDGHIGYDISLDSWACDEEYVRKAARHAYSRIMALNGWEYKDSLPEENPCCSAN